RVVSAHGALARPRLAPGPSARVLPARIGAGAGKALSGEASGTEPADLEPGVLQPRDPDAAAAPARVNEPAIADVDTVVTELVEEHQITRLQLVPRDRHAVLVLLGDVVGHRDAGQRVHVLDQARAVETLRALAAPEVGDADESLHEAHRLGASALDVGAARPIVWTVWLSCDRPDPAPDAQEDEPENLGAGISTTASRRRHCRRVEQNAGHAARSRQLRDSPPTGTALRENPDDRRLTQRRRLDVDLTWP